MAGWRSRLLWRAAAGRTQQKLMQQPPMPQLLGLRQCRACRPCPHRYPQRWTTCRSGALSWLTAVPRHQPCLCMGAAQPACTPARWCGNQPRSTVPITARGVGTLCQELAHCANSTSCSTQQFVHWVRLVRPKHSKRRPDRGCGCVQGAGLEQHVKCAAAGRPRQRRARQPG